MPVRKGNIVALRLEGGSGQGTPADHNVAAGNDVAISGGGVVKTSTTANRIGRATESLDRSTQTEATLIKVVIDR